MKSVRLPSFKRGTPFSIEVDGHHVVAYEGETIATALLATGINTFFYPEQTANPSSRVFCGIGSCMQCLVTINDQPSHLACQTKAHMGMKIETDKHENL